VVDDDLLLIRQLVLSVFDVVDRNGLCLFLGHRDLLSVSELNRCNDEGQ
jgi:hypothetical protein